MDQKTWAIRGAISTGMTQALSGTRHFRSSDEGRTAIWICVFSMPVFVEWVEIVFGLQFSQRLLGEWIFGGDPRVCA